MGGGTDDDALVLRLPVRPAMRRTSIAAIVLAVGGLAAGVQFLLAGPLLVGVVLVAWSAYVLPGWWRALRRPSEGPEVLRMDPEGVTVHHGRRQGEPLAWSARWPQVRSLAVREIAVPGNLQAKLGPVTKVVTFDVLDHREVEGPRDHRERLLRWALLTGSTTSRTRLQVLLGMVGPDAVRRVAGWLAEHRPAQTLDFDVTGPKEVARRRVPSRVAVLAPGHPLGTELVTRLRQQGLNPESVDADDAGDVDALTERLRACTVAVAVDADAVSLSEAAARAGLDRVLLAVTTAADPTALVRSDRAWTVLDLTEEEIPPGPSPTLDEGAVADAMVALLADQESIHRVWRVGPDGAAVAAGERA